MAFVLLLAYLVLIFVRPWELVPALASWQIMDVVSLVVVAGALLAWLAGHRPPLKTPQLHLFVAFVAWAMFSVVASTGWFGGAVQAFLYFARSSGLVFVLVILNVDSVSRIRRMGATLALIGLFLSVQVVLAFHFGVNADRLVLLQGFDPADVPDYPRSSPFQVENHIQAGLEAGTIVPRARSLGFLNDPNDLAQALVAFLPLLVVFRRPRRPLRNALLVWAPLAFSLYVVVLTRSRGGLLALLVVLFLAFRERLGRTLSLLVSAGLLAGLLAAGALGQREMEMDTSALGRVEAWSEGLQMLKHSPVWGVGFGNFTEFHQLVAHNSFVHCLAETGLIGYMLWLALIMLTFSDLISVSRAEPEDEEDRELVRWARALFLALAGFLAGAVLLSRSYGIILFLLLALGVAAARVARLRGWAPDQRNPLVWAVWAGVAGGVSIIAVWLFVRWSH